MSDTRLKITTTQPVTEKAAMYAAVHDGIPVVHKDGRRTECVTVSPGNAANASA